MRNEHWIAKYWRPAAAWVYLVINIFDFIIAPLVNIYYFGPSGKYIQWIPLTLMGAGTFHLAFGAILGVSAWSRGQEKMARVDERTYYGNDLKKVPVIIKDREL